MAVEPIRIVPYDPNWPRMFGAERDRVEAAVGVWVEAIGHIGSTAVPGLDAKPVVDVLAGVRNLGDANRCILPLEEVGYECRGEARPRSSTTDDEPKAAILYTCYVVLQCAYDTIRGWPKKGETRG